MTADEYRDCYAEDRLRYLANLITMPVKERDLDPLLTARNSVAHLGAHDDAITQQADARAKAGERWQESDYV